MMFCDEGLATIFTAPCDLTLFEALSDTREALGWAGQTQADKIVLKSIEALRAWQARIEAQE